MGFHFFLFLLGIAVISQSKAFGSAEGREIFSSSYRYPAGSTRPLHAVLYVSSSSPATDFFVRLIDVHPDGTPYPVFCTYANPYSTRGLETENTGPKGEKIWKCKIELPPTSNLFFKEHKMKDRNMQCGFSALQESECGLRARRCHGISWSDPKGLPRQKSSVAYYSSGNSKREMMCLRYPSLRKVSFLIALRKMMEREIFGCAQCMRLFSEQVRFVQIGLLNKEKNSEYE